MIIRPAKPTVHLLKTWPVFYKEIVSRRKGFEYRKNDRGYRAADLLCLGEYSSHGWTGSCLFVKVTYILLDGAEHVELVPGWCIMSISVIERGDRAKLWRGNHKAIDEFCKAQGWEPYLLRIERPKAFWVEPSTFEN